MATKMYWAQLGSFRRLIAVRKGGTLSFVHHDHLGSTKAVTGTTGGPMKYYPYGSTCQEPASPPADNLFSGQKRDLSTGLYYCGARYYGGAIGRFVQPDSIVQKPGSPQSLNRFSYGLNNPLRYTDPTGHFTEDEIRNSAGYDQAEDWKKNDPAWWALLSEAQVGDAVQVTVTTRAVDPGGQTHYGKTYYGGRFEYVERDKQGNKTHRLVLVNGSRQIGLEDYRSVTAEVGTNELWRPPDNQCGPLRKIETPTVFMRANPPQWRSRHDMTARSFVHDSGEAAKIISEGFNIPG